jgi:hypothetical protein
MWQLGFLRFIWSPSVRHARLLGDEVVEAVDLVVLRVVDRVLLQLESISWNHCGRNLQTYKNLIWSNLTLPLCPFMSLMCLKIQDYCPSNSAKFWYVAFRLKFVQNLRTKICPKSFRSKGSFVKSVPGPLLSPSVSEALGVCWRKQGHLYQGCQIFLDTIYQNGGKYTILTLHIPITEWP